jgi:hypothetical protein
LKTLACLLVLSCMFAASPTLSFAEEYHPNRAADDTFGGRHYVAYWSAFQVLRQGGNPYDPRTIFAAQRHLRPDAEDAQLFLYPPWMLIILAPLLSLNFTLSYHLWLALNLLFTISIVVLTRNCIPRLCRIFLCLAHRLFLYAPVGCDCLWSAHAIHYCPNPGHRSRISGQKRFFGWSMPGPHFSKISSCILNSGRSGITRNCRKKMEGSGNLRFGILRNFACHLFEISPPFPRLA